MTAGRRNPGCRFRGLDAAGFTLIEVLVALAILSIAMTAVFTTFLSQQQSFTVQSRVAEMQQNLRTAVDCMTRDIRMAGYGMPMTTGTSSDNVALPALPTHGITTIRALFPVDSTTGPDQIYVMYLYDMDASQPPGTLAFATAANPGFVTLVQDNVTPPHGFNTGGGELVLVTDGTNAELFQSTSATSGSTPTVNFGGGQAYNDFALHTHEFAVGATPGESPTVVAKARFVRYFIDVSDPNHPTLMVDRMITGQDPQPLADDIEDLQLSFGLDTNGDGVIDASRNAAVGGATLAAGEIPQIRQVRLHLVARSRLPEKDWIGRRPAAGNRDHAEATDGYRRRTIEVNIDVRNSGT